MAEVIRLLYCLPMERMTTIDKFKWKKDEYGNTVMYIDESGIKKRKKKADQNTVAELTREGLYKENKWLWEENQKLKEENEIIMRNADGIAHHNCELMKKVKELEKKLGIE